MIPYGENRGIHYDVGIDNPKKLRKSKKTARQDGKKYIDYQLNEFDNEPCTHPGCRSHISHPCEVCGRQWNIGVDLSSQDDVCVVDSEFIK